MYSISKSQKRRNQKMKSSQRPNARGREGANINYAINWDEKRREGVEELG